MPQRTSYFALALPKGWWLLGFDLALDDDINIEQFHFFAKLAKSMKPDDAVIIVSHGKSSFACLYQILWVTHPHHLLRSQFLTGS